MLHLCHHLHLLCCCQSHQQNSFHKRIVCPHQLLRLVFYQNSPSFGAIFGVGGFTSLIFKIHDDPLAFSLSENKKIFPNIYDESFLCIVGEVDGESRTKKDTVVESEGNFQWVFSYRGKYYADLLSTTAHRDAESCRKSNYKMKYDLSDTVFVYEIGGAKPDCSIKIKRQIKD